ncbi:hypothetical protein C8Q76DRAFT_790441 [Earliella scabrosa]|nr:hypothetical protein C8Q76DRAFT_790441 [Earliella scabrosa]
MPESLPPSEKAERRALTASYVVALYRQFLAQDRGPPSSSSSLPPAPAHISADLANDCRSVARVLANAIQNQFVVTWDAVKFAAHLKQTTVGTEKYENGLLRQFPPLIPLKEVINRKTPFPVIEDPCVFVDCEG